MARFRLTTKNQVSGYRFYFRRLEHALIRRDTGMLDDPVRSQSSALTTGIVFGIIGIAGCLIISVISPKGLVGTNKIVADKSSGALYVLINGRLNPVLNLASARLIVGSNVNPTFVKSSEIDKMPRGPLVGIPGAPVRISPNTSSISQWTLCDTASTGSSVPLDPKTGLPVTTLSLVKTTVIGAEIDTSATNQLKSDKALLVSYGGNNWFLYNSQRSLIDITDSRVTLALGISSNITPAPISSGLFNAIAEGQPLTPPQIPDAGKSSDLKLSNEMKIGSIITEPDTQTFYVAVPGGLQKVSSVAAQMIRNTDSQGNLEPITLTSDQVAKVPQKSTLDTSAIPERKITLVDNQQSPITCYSWKKGESDKDATVTVTTSKTLPLNATERTFVFDLVTAPKSNGTTADSSFTNLGPGKLVQITGSNPDALSRSGLFWVSDTGVRYGVELSEAGSNDNTLASLNTGRPVPAPWSIISMFATGPTLSRADALLAHDGLEPDPLPRPVVIDTQNGDGAN